MMTRTRAAPSLSAEMICAREVIGAAHLNTRAKARAKANWSAGLSAPADW
jgi:hypothetical protein